MEKIVLTDEQKEKHVFASDIIELFNKYEDEDLLENIDDYVGEACSLSAETLNKQLLLGTVCLYGPNEWDDWTDEEKLLLFDRWDIIDKLVALSKIEFLNLHKNDDEDEEDPDTNNGKGMIC